MSPGDIIAIIVGASGFITAIGTTIYQLLKGRSEHLAGQRKDEIEADRVVLDLLKVLEGRITQQQARITVLEKKSADEEEITDQLQLDNLEMKREIFALKEANNALKDENVILKNKVIVLQKEVEALRVENAELKTENQDLRDRLEIVEKRRREKSEPLPK